MRRQRWYEHYFNGGISCYWCGFSLFHMRWKIQSSYFLSQNSKWKRKSMMKRQPLKKAKNNTSNMQGKKKQLLWFLCVMGWEWLQSTKIKHVPKRQRRGVRRKSPQELLHSNTLKLEEKLLSVDFLLLLHKITCCH